MARKPAPIPTAKLVAIADTLRLHCRSVDGRSIYEDGWNDNRIAEEIDATPWMVRNTRVSLMGLLLREEASGSSDAALAHIQERLAHLERSREIDTPSAALMQLEGRVASLTRLQAEIDLRVVTLERWRTNLDQRYAMILGEV